MSRFAVMRVLSVNVGRPERIAWGGREMTTGINKRPVDGPVWIGRLGLDGDVQVDRKVHGGEGKAVYIYPAQHYAFWRRDLGIPDLSYGAFGENLTVDGLDEAGMHVGDELRVGSATLIVREPRLPCNTLATRMQRADMQKRFLRSGRTGFYLSVAYEGEVQVGDAVAVVKREPAAVRIADLVAYRVEKGGSEDLWRRALETDALPEGWRREFTHRVTERQ